MFKYLFQKMMVAGVILFWSMQPSAIYGAPKMELLPENYKEVQVGTKTITIFLEEDDPEELAMKATVIHKEYARDGWLLLQITPYVDDEDTEGLFLTYQKKTQQ